jgi:hypothetical protein
MDNIYFQKMLVKLSVSILTNPDMRKGMDKMLTHFENCLLETLNPPCISFLILKLKYYVTLTYIIQYDHLNAHLNLMKVTNHA